MGIVNCRRHGMKGGPLCCRHVLDAVRGCGPVAQSTALRCDVDGDGKFVLHFRLCIACAAKDGLLHQEEISFERAFDETRFPSTAPVCSDCLQAHELMR